MITSSAGFALATSSHHIAGAILIRAKKGATAMHAFLLVRFGGVEGRVRTGWIADKMARLSQSRVIVRAIPIVAPFPDIPGHVVETITVRGKLPDRCNAGEAIGTGVLNGEDALVDVGHPLAA